MSTNPLYFDNGSTLNLGIALLASCRPIFNSIFVTLFALNIQRCRRNFINQRNRKAESRSGSQLQF
jgi:hypothetical protein